MLRTSKWPAASEYISQMRFSKLLAAAGCGLMLSSAGLAVGASYWIWKSKLDGRTTCQQVMQGEWIKVDGPFRDSQCKTRT
jgi:hypothetical protein